MRIPALILLGLGLSATGFAQNNSVPNKVLAAGGKPLTYADSGLVKQLFFTGLREKTVENYKQASELFNRILQIDPANDASLFELANLQKNQNNYAAARPLLEKAASIKPDNEWYWVALADNYERSNDVAKLENVFNQLIRINPEKADYYFDKANALYLLKRYDEALKFYDRVEEISGPSDELLASRQKIYLKQGNITKAADAIEQMIAANPGQIKYYLMLAEIYNSNNLNDKAIAVLERAKKADPKNGLVHLALADIYRDRKSYDASFKELEVAFAVPDIDIEQKLRIILGYVPKFPDANARASALELSTLLIKAHPASDKAFAIYGDMLLQNSKVPEARVAYKKALTLNPQFYIVHEQLVRIELADNLIDDAIRDGENALSYFPNQALMNYFVGVAWQQKKDYNKAIGYLKNVVSLETDDKEILAQSYSALGDCYHAVSDNKSSDAAYEKALSYDPDNAFVLNNYAYYLSVRNEQLEKAATMSKRSNELKANNASFEDTYAWILFRQKKYAEAKLWMEKAIQHGANSSAVQTEHYGDILFLLGNTDAAVQKWEKAKSIGGASTLIDRKINEKKYIE
ncbi:tetratricopeptide repeat protein [Mucilaginibacter pallidiroseus]|nr:tetratricopeptide repeat protein [Mucilaginibacter pallidiroseus]